jgi:mono/diheme cytochrome c family protein
VKPRRLQKRLEATRWMTWVGPLAGCALVAACSSAPTGFGAGGGTNASNPSDVGNPTSDASVNDPSTSTGLPCDVRDLFATECTSCHGSTPSQGAASSLITYSDLMKKSSTQPTQTEAQVSLTRMKNGVPPMPPPPASASTSADIATLSNWIAAGYPTGTCESSNPVTLPDGGALPDAAIYDTPTVCTSGNTWTLGETKSADMKPGSECQTCHVLGGDASGKEFDIAGTVYPTAHEPDDCDGTSSATVVITDAKGATTSLTVGTSGNFYHDNGFGFLAIATPYTAVVTVGSKTRPMLTPQADGNCNHCHTTAGTMSAPGRVMAP